MRRNVIIQPPWHPTSSWRGGGGGGKNFIKVCAGERVRNINMVGRGVVLLREVILLERVMGF